MNESTRWLLCKPDHYTVSYQINPWMDVSKVPEHSNAQQQYDGLVQAFKTVGAPIEFVAPEKGLPDMVFTANAGLIRGKKAVLSRFKFNERQGEERHFKRWLEEHGFTVVECQTGSFEGEGDALFSRPGLLFAGHGFRSERRTLDEVAQALDCETLVPCHLLDGRFYHLDTCFAPINEKQALFFPPAFDRESITQMEKHIELIAVPEVDALKFACNAVVIGKQIIMPAQCPTTDAKLRALGFTPHGVLLTEYLKAGGAAKCLCLQLDRT